MCTNILMTLLMIGSPPSPNVRVALAIAKAEKAIAEESQSTTPKLENTTAPTETPPVYWESSWESDCVGDS